MIQKTHTGYLHSWIIQNKVTPLTLQLSACEHKCLSTWKHWQGWDLSDRIAHPYSQGWIFKCWEKGETLAVAKVYIYLLLFGMTNFTPKMTHTVSVFDLIAFVIIIINDNNSTAVMPQGPSWDQGSVLIGTEHAEKTNLALRSLHLSWRRQTKCREKEVVLSLFCLKTERLSDLPEVRQVFGGRGSTGVVLKAPRRWGAMWGHTCPHLHKCLAWCPARGTASWQQGSAGCQRDWKDYKREVASTGWRWGWALGHLPTCTAALPYSVPQHTKYPPWPRIWAIPCF